MAGQVGQVDSHTKCNYNGYNKRVNTLKISSRFSIAVHILSLLAIAKDAHCTSEWIAQSVNTHPVVIRRILGMLKKAGFVKIPKGSGGAYLIKDLDDITLLDVYRAVDAVPGGELFQFHEHPNPECPVGGNIEAVLQLILLRAQAAMEQILADVTMEQLVENLNEKIGS